MSGNFTASFSGKLQWIRTILKRAFDRISNERVRIGILQVLPFWVASLATGLVAVMYTKMFGWAETATSRILQESDWWIFLLAPVCFLVAWWLVNRYARYAAGSGIPQVMASIELTASKSGHRVKKLLGLRIIIVKL